MDVRASGRNRGRTSRNRRRTVEVEDDDAWVESLEAWRHNVRRLTGNPVEVLEVSADEAAKKVAGRGQVWVDIRRDGHVVHGFGIDELRAVRSA